MRLALDGPYLLCTAEAACPTCEFAPASRMPYARPAHLTLALTLTLTLTLTLALALTLTLTPSPPSTKVFVGGLSGVGDAELTAYFAQVRVRVRGWG